MLAEETGGIAVVNKNDFDKALKRIDAETSDYYVLGYYSSNPDPTQAPPEDRGEGDAEGRRRVQLAEGIRAQAAAAPAPPPQRSQPLRRARQAVAARAAFASARRRVRERALGASSRPRFRPLDGLLQIRLVEVAPMKSTPSRAQATAVLPSPVNGSITSSDARQAVQPQALLGQPRREGRRVRAIAVAPLNRLVRDEPGVAAAADAVGRAAPARDVRLILIGHAEREPVERASRRCGVK